VLAKVEALEEEIQDLKRAIKKPWWKLW